VGDAVFQRFRNSKELVKQHSKQKRVKEFNWIILEKLNSEL